MSDLYQAYHAADAAQARAAFVKRYGRQPERVFKSGPVWLAGPVKEVTHRDRQTTHVEYGAGDDSEERKDAR
jgi:hypothetical protein